MPGDEEAAYPPSQSPWILPRIALGRRRHVRLLLSSVLLFFSIFYVFPFLLPSYPREWITAVVNPETFRSSCKPLPWPFASPLLSGKRFSFPSNANNPQLEIVMGCSHPSSKPSLPLLNHQDYAKTHSYGFTLLTLYDYSAQLQGLTGHWIKIVGLIDLLKAQLALPESERLKWLFWCDFDTVIINFKIQLEDFLPPSDIVNHPFLLGVQDGNGFNAGIFYIAVKQDSLDFLESVLAIPRQAEPPPLPFNEQSAMQTVFTTQNLIENRKVIMIPRTWISSWEEEHARGDKTFLVHLAGLTKKKLIPHYVEVAKRRGEHKKAWEMERQREFYREEISMFWRSYSAPK